jgi:glycosyltransferase involved in cell wall biosynthesis
VSHIFVYRNCFTGNVSGGDMHTGGICEWITRHHPEHPLYLVHARGDGQREAYLETTTLKEITYPDTSVTKPALMYPLRAMKAGRLPLPWHPNSNLFVAGSHFLPDVWPALGQGRKAPGAVRAVYIHHIVQDMPRPGGLNTMLANSQEQFCFNLIKHDFDKIITVNQGVVDGLRQRGFRQPILVSGNFVNPHRAQPRGYSNKDITMAFCGRLVTQKGVDDFLKVCEALQARTSEFKAVMIGEGPERERLQKTIDDKQLHVELTGFVPEAKKFELLAQAKLFVLPSREEGWGIVIAESLSVGTPVLAYHLPVYDEPFGNVLRTVPLDRQKQLIEQAIHLLAGWQQDSDSYGALQKELVAHARQFDREAIAAKEFTFLMEDVHD